MATIPEHSGGSIRMVLTRGPQKGRQDMDHVMMAAPMASIQGLQCTAVTDS